MNDYKLLFIALFKILSTLGIVVPLLKNIFKYKIAQENICKNIILSLKIFKNLNSVLILSAKISSYITIHDFISNFYLRLNSLKY